MSLDVDLISPDANGAERWAIFIREDGANREISLDEWSARFPGRRPTLCHIGGNDVIYSANITHNLGKMADVAGIYEHLWRPEEIPISTAGELIEPLRRGLEAMKADPGKFNIHNAENGWGCYENLVGFVENYLAACEACPGAKVVVSR